MRLYGIILIALLLSGAATGSRLYPKSQYRIGEDARTLSSLDEDYLVGGLETIYHFRKPLTYLTNYSPSDNVSASYLTGDSIVVALSSGTLRLYDRNFSLRWTVSLPSYVGYEQALYSDGSRILVGDMQGNILLMNEDGSLDWTYKTDAYVINVKIVGDRVLAVSDKAVYVLSGDGALLERLPFESYIIGSEISPEGIIISTGDEHLHRISLSGMTVSSLNVQDPAVAIISSGNRTYVGTRDGMILAMEIGGNVSWERAVNGSVISFAISDEGVIASTLNNKVYVLSRHGVLRREYETSSRITKIIVNGGQMILVSADGIIYLADIPVKRRLDNLLTVGILALSLLASSYILARFWKT
ncbi:MAG: PQQ-binding-like beta-propeller repeat protein [Candidatus Altiarchaeota archaeon]